MDRCVFPRNFEKITGDTSFNFEPSMMLDLDDVTLAKKAGEEEKRSNFTVKKCLICYCENFSKNFIKIPFCGHEFCFSCLIKHLVSQINTSKILSIKCPSECNQIFPDSFIRKLLCTHQDMKLLRKFEVSKLNQIPNLIWCSTPGCDGYMISDAENSNPKICCPICQKATCFSCRHPWHENLGCEDVMDIEFKKYVVREGVKQCPKCLTFLEKKKGCNPIVCTICGYQFCRLCLKKFSKNHFKWYNFLGCSGEQYRKKPKIGKFFGFFGCK